MKYLCQFIEEKLRELVKDILQQGVNERDADFKRGMVRFGEDFLKLPTIIKNRMEAERNPQYKDLINAIAGKEAN